MADNLELLKDFSLVFLPLLVAMDPLAILPFWVPFYGSVERGRRKNVLYSALLTGMVIGLLFLGLGKGIFLALGISASDFMVAGGLILLAVSLRELLSTSTADAAFAPNELLAIVPIGTPLLVGPATISMLILLSGLFAIWLVVAAFLLNMLIAWIVFTQSERIIKFLGKGGLQAFSKIAYLLLAAIAVNLIRRGIAEILQSVQS